jgi:hypothetical protein
MRKSSIFWGSAIVLLGVVLLASNLQLIRGNVWQFFWPALIILAGVWFLMKSSSKEKMVETVASNVPLEGATDAEIEFNHGAGRLEINASAQPGDLVSGTFVGGVTADVNRVGSMAKVSLHTPTDHVFEGPWGIGGHGLEWKVGINPNVPVKLHFHTGATESVYDLSGLKATEVVLETGASSNFITLPASAGYTKVKIESGASSIKVTIPQGVAANIHVKSGLSGINIDSTRFVRDGDYYRSADYATAANKADLEIETGAASVEIH